MAPPQGIQILSQTEDTSGLPLRVSWWVPYLAKGHRPEFNNSPGENTNCGRILGPRRLFECDLNNGPSPGHSSLGSDGSNSVQVSHL